MNRIAELDKKERKVSSMLVSTNKEHDKALQSKAIMTEDVKHIILLVRLITKEIIYIKMNRELSDRKLQNPMIAASG